MKSLDNDDTFSSISKKNKFNNQLIEKASLEIRERRMRESGAVSSKRAQSHAGPHALGTSSESNLEKLQSAFLLGRDRGGGDETSNNVKSAQGDVDPAVLSEKK